MESRLGRHVQILERRNEDIAETDDLDREMRDTVERMKEEQTFSCCICLSSLSSR